MIIVQKYARNHDKPCDLCIDLKNKNLNKHINKKIKTSKNSDSKIKCIDDNIINDLERLFVKLLILYQKGKCYICGKK